MPTKRINESGTESRKSYTGKQMLEALTIFKKNDYNYQKTINITGISRNTLKKWVKEHPECLEDNRTDTTIRKIESVVAQKEESLLKKYYSNSEDILDIAYKRLREILPSCSNPIALLEVIKVFNPLNGKEVGDNEKGASVVMETIQRLSVAVKKIGN